MGKAKPKLPPKGADTGPAKGKGKYRIKGNPVKGKNIFGNWQDRISRKGGK